MASQTQKSHKRRPRQKRSRETVEVIVQATTQILSRDGASEVTTNHIADEAGVSIGSLYQYFENKEELVDEVRRRYTEAFRDRLMILVGEITRLPVAEAIERCVRALIDIHAENVGLHNAVSTTGADENDRRLLHGIVTAWLEARAAEIRRPNRALAATVALEAVEALVHGTALREPDRIKDEEFAAEVTDLLVRYLVAPRPGRN